MVVSSAKLKNESFFEILLFVFNVYKIMSDNKPFYILSCDGGGVRGLATVTFLYHMSEHLKKINPEFKLYDFFDMYAGTSIGALIILIILVKEYEGEDLMKVFNKDLCGKIMDKSIWDKLLGIIQNKPKYNGKGKKEVIEDFMKNTRFCDLKKHVVIPAYNITKQITHIFHSDQANTSLLCSEIADATSAAPAYFPPVKINCCNNKNESHVDCWFIDGGIVANNPTICAIAKAKKLLKDNPRKVVVVNIGTGLKTRYINGEKARGYGGIEWLLNNILGIAMDETVIYEQASDLLYDHHYININGKLENVNDEIDDCSDENMKELVKIGEKWWNEQKHKFDNFFELR